MMKINNIKVLGLVAFTAWIFSVVPSFAQSQSFRERLTRMQSAYGTLDSMHVHMSVQVFETEKETTPYFKEDADVRKHRDSYSYRFGDMTMVMNSTALIMIDKDSREIIYTPRSPEKEKQFFKDPVKVSIDSILSLYDSPTFVSKEEKGDHFRVFQKTGPVNQVDIFIHPVEDWLTRIEYRYSDGHYVAIDFTQFERNPVLIKEVFDEATYVKLVNGEMKAGAGFKGYHVSVVEGNSKLN